MASAGPRRGQRRSWRRPPPAARQRLSPTATSSRFRVRSLGACQGRLTDCLTWCRANIAPMPRKTRCFPRLQRELGFHAHLLPPPPPLPLVPPAVRLPIPPHHHLHTHLPPYLLPPSPTPPHPTTSYGHAYGARERRGAREGPQRTLRPPA